MADTRRRALPRASLLDDLRISATMLAPTVAQGVILRRPRMVALAARLDANGRADRTLRRMRERYGPGPLRTRSFGRRALLPLTAEDAHRLLARTPDPFTPANREKTGALAHFEPEGSLISRGPARETRRAFNEEALDWSRPAHRSADAFLPRIAEEAAVLVGRARSAPPLTWDVFAPAYWRAIRRVVLGDAARDDEAVTDLLGRLRADANWAYFHRRRTADRERLLETLRDYARRADPGSLAGYAARLPGAAGASPESQIAHWLFAYDATVIATYQALALLATHPEEAARVREEMAAQDPSSPRGLVALERLRACVREALRLWPTTLAILRDTTADTEWHGDRVPAGTAVVFFSSFFHRDERRLPFADRFEPRVWLDGTAADDWSLAPFSRGPGQCPGQNVVLLTATAMLAALLREHDVRPLPPVPLAPDRPLPRTIDHTALRFDLRPRRPDGDGPARP